MTYPATTPKALTLHPWNQCPSHRAGYGHEQPPGSLPTRPSPYHHSGLGEKAAAAQRHAQPLARPKINRPLRRAHGRRIHFDDVDPGIRIIHALV